MSTPIDPNFETDIRSLVLETPRLVNDIKGSLRGGLSAQFRVPSGRHWKVPGYAYEFEDLLRSLGFYLRFRRFGSGMAVYVSTVPFNTVLDGRHRKTVSVSEY